MTNFNAVQISLRSIHFDRPTTRSMSGYIIGLAQRNIDGDGQLYVSQGSFKVRRDNTIRTKDDEVFTWDGDGELIFSTKLEGLERIGLDLYFVRDNRRLREFGSILKEAFEDDAVGTKVANIITDVVSASNPTTGAIVALSKPVAHFVGKLLEKKRNKIKIYADGSLKVSSILRDYDDDGDGIRIWGTSRADRGYFVTEWDLVTMNDPEARVFKPQIPQSLIDKMES